MTTLALICFCVTAMPDTQSELRTRYAEWDHAYFARDVKRLASMLDAEFRLVGHSGRVTSRKDYVASLWKGELTLRYETTLLKVEPRASKAVAWTREVSQVSGQPAHTHRYRDTWVRREGHWKLLESKTVGED